MQDSKCKLKSTILKSSNQIKYSKSENQIKYDARIAAESVVDRTKRYPVSWNNRGGEFSIWNGSGQFLKGISPSFKRCPRTRDTEIHPREKQRLVLLEIVPRSKLRLQPRFARNEAEQQFFTGPLFLINYAEATSGTIYRLCFISIGRDEQSSSVVRTSFKITR